MHGNEEGLIDFGAGSDILIKDKSDMSKSSQKDFGLFYKLPKGIIHGSEVARTYLAGAFNFNVLEIEVFKFLN